MIAKLPSLKAFADDLLSIALEHADGKDEAAVRVEWYSYSYLDEVTPGDMDADAGISFTQRSEVPNSFYAPEMKRRLFGLLGS